MVAWRSKVVALSAATAISVLAIGSAGAATFSIVQGNGTVSALGSQFNPDLWTNPDGVTSASVVTKFFNSPATGGLQISPVSDLDITLTFMGKEAAFTNAADSAVVWDNTNVLLNTQTPGVSSVTVHWNVLPGSPADPDYVPFIFRRITGGTADAYNHGTIASGLGMAFYVVGGGNVAYAFFDDSGAGPDSDYDDMVVRITAVERATGEVPLPAAAWLFGSALVGMSVLGRRRRKSAAPTVG